MRGLALLKLEKMQFQEDMIASFQAPGGEHQEGRARQVVEHNDVLSHFILALAVVLEQEITQIAFTRQGAIDNNSAKNEEGSRIHVEREGDRSESFHHYGGGVCECLVNLVPISILKDSEKEAMNLSQIPDIILLAIQDLILNFSLFSVSGVAPEKKEDVFHAEMDERLSLRKHRFMHFASLEYEGEYYMTPRDFLFSVMFDQVERKASAKKLTKKEVDAALLYVAKAKPGPTFFRDLGDKGLISYAEYLFLLTILTKPQTGLQIAFKMLDTDGNEQVEKKEFFKLQKIIGKEDDLKAAGDETVLQALPSKYHLPGSKHENKKRIADFNHDECFPVMPQANSARKGGKNLETETELEDCGVNTLLLVHFFGKEGKQKLRYSEFFRFMENLQTEVQEMEFIKFSKGLNVMRKEDFVAWLLYFTDEDNNEIYWQNVKDRIEAGENISLEEFKTFCKFTNNLEDFSIAMQMFTVANRPVKRAEFKRAVKVATGQELSDNVLDTIFKIFDLDGDDCLSHSEFLGVLRNRIHRGSWCLIPPDPVWMSGLSTFMMINHDN
ncbi:Calcium uptake protein 2, mitochondrial [Pitangus sulphuratus]|nr:Calcium uptake protein 2, mitochondrial [Pitangus sulphuratus]